MSAGNREENQLEEIVESYGLERMVAIKVISIRGTMNGITVWFSNFYRF
jgi:hypothetical protein